MSNYQKIISVIKIVKKYILKLPKKLENGNIIQKMSNSKITSKFPKLSNYSKLSKLSKDWVLEVFIMFHEVFIRLKRFQRVQKIDKLPQNRQLRQ